MQRWIDSFRHANGRDSSATNERQVSGSPPQDACRHVDDVDHVTEAVGGACSLCG